MEVSEQQTKTKRKPLSSIIVIVFLLLVGGGLRVLSTHIQEFGTLFPWLSRVSVTVYYIDESQQVLVPVVITLAQDESPLALVDYLHQPPQDLMGISDVITIEITQTEIGATQVYLSQMPDEIVRLALSHTLLSHPSITSVQLYVNNEPLPQMSTNLLYFVHDRRIVATPAQAESPRQAIEAYLSNTNIALIGLPAAVRLLSYDLNTSNGLLRLSFSYTDTLREFAIQDANAMQQVLTGIVASMTGYPAVTAVMFDFEGRAQLGLGQCADMLRAPQTRPLILNAF